MITLNINNSKIELSTHAVEGRIMYKAQDLLKGYGMEDSKQVSNTLSNWKLSVEAKGGKIDSVSVQGKFGGTYLTKRDLLKLAGYVDFAFEDAVYEAFEALSEGRVDDATMIANKVIKEQIAKASQYLKDGTEEGKAVMKALRLQVGNPTDMIETLVTISKGCSVTHTCREGYWERCRNNVETLRDEYRVGTKQFDLSVYSQFEQVLHYCTKRIAQIRAKQAKK